MKAITLSICLLALTMSALAETPPMPKTPAPVDDVVYARSFILEKGFKFFWREERPEVAEGLILVLKADKALLVPRAAMMPVLYVGDQTAQRVNHGHESGHLIVLVPGRPDLTKAPIWFGTPNLHDQVDASLIEAERKKADEAGIQPLPAKNVQAALALGGEPLEAANLRDVLRTEVAELILKYSPQEKHIAEDFRVPDVQRKPQTDED
ncbi:MAG: hypothetical protein JSV78_13475 [Phycisphaerales bacterium]|nr:MAG: hypothetical protein JSV78_13475 [Phycisphaerales bacterium]